MNILIGMEESQTICKAFRNKGHNAYSCDILPCSGGHPEWHYQCDIYWALFDRKWDIIICHPVCTKLCVSGNHKYAKGKPGYQERLQAIADTEILWLMCIKICDKICFENPVSVLATESILLKPQYIQPYEFGHNASKKTGLYLYGLPELKPTNRVYGRIVNGKERFDNQTDSGQNKLGPSKERSIIRSTTYKGIADAMADQWG